MKTLNKTSKVIKANEWPEGLSELSKEIGYRIGKKKWNSTLAAVIQSGLCQKQFEEVFRVIDCDRIARLDKLADKMKSSKATVDYSTPAYAYVINPTHVKHADYTPVQKASATAWSHSCLAAAEAACPNDDKVSIAYWKKEGRSLIAALKSVA